MKTWVITEEQRERLLEEARRPVDTADDTAVLLAYATLRGRVQGCLENLMEMVEDTDDGR